jgi:phage gp36-like protein
MAYVTADDVQERLGDALYVQLTDDEGTGAADLDRVNEAIGGAEGEVNSYLGQRYAVPVSLSGQDILAEVLRSFVLDLVEQRLHARRPPVPDDLVSKRSEALVWLRRVAEGEVVLPAATPLANSEAAAMPGRASGSPRELTRDELSRL